MRHIKIIAAENYTDSQYSLIDNDLLSQYISSVDEFHQTLPRELQQQLKSHVNHTKTYVQEGLVAKKCSSK